MNPTSTTFRSRRGFAIIPAIAVLAVLAVLGVSLVMISATQHVGAGLDIQGVRAYHAARSGVEWALFQVLRNAADCAAIHDHTIEFPDNLTGFRARVQCASTAHVEAGNPLTMFQITVTACNDAVCPSAAASPPATYVSRQLRVTVGR